ncbi:MAG: MotA/TolQ/ExbB proton channel family protein [Bacteroidetes bacterium]|nr:MotA/TolQ/ExbB proton channel family protein [Bacteroidota bacterium]MCX6300242.1 MotA/TolQ/ExbB proton channel family protein [Bacteroidota bacterium]
MNRNSNNGLLFLIGIVFCIGFIIYLASSHLIFNEHNWLLSLIITTLLVFSIGSLIHLRGIMGREEAEIDSIFIQKLTSIEDIKNVTKSLKNSLIKERLENINSVYEQTNKINYEEIEYLTLKRQRNYGAIEKYIINATILIGWIGTFLGIIQSVKNLNINKNNVSMPMVEGIISGLSLAIGASILGIFSSLILGFLYTAYKNYENNVFTKLEEISVLKIVPHYTIFESSSIAKAIAESMNRVLPNIIRQSTDDLKEATLNLKRVTEEIQHNQQNFSLLIQQIETSVTNATENNIQIQVLLRAFNGHISKLTPTLDKIDDVITQNSNEFEKISYENQANYEIISKTYSTLKSHSGTLKIFSENIKNDFNFFLANSSRSNEEFKEVILEGVKMFVSNQTDTSKKISELHDKLVHSIVNIAQNQKRNFEKKRLNEKDIIVSESKKKNNLFFSFLNRFK